MNPSSNALPYSTIKTRGIRKQQDRNGAPVDFKICGSNFLFSYGKTSIQFRGKTPPALQSKVKKSASAKLEEEKFFTKQFSLAVT